VSRKVQIAGSRRKYETEKKLGEQQRELEILIKERMEEKEINRGGKEGKM
jgi:hypothetical protein